MKKFPLPLRVFLVLSAIAIILLTLHLVFQHLNLAYNEKHGQVFEISNRFDVDDEASVPTWFSQAIWAGVALGSLLAATLTSNKSTRKLWVIMIFIGLFFSIDEVSGIHELSLQSLHLLFFGLEQSSSLLNAWWIVLPLILIFGIWFMTRLYKVLRLRLWVLLMLGGLIFLVGATGFELYGNDIPHNTFYYQGVVTGTEESLEMLGGMLVLYVILKYLDDTHGKRLKRIWRESHDAKK